MVEIISKRGGQKAITCGSNENLTFHSSVMHESYQ